MKLLQKNNSTVTYLFFALGIFLLIFGCTPAPLFIKPDFGQKQIKSIAVIPVTDNRESNKDTTHTNKSLVGIEKIITEELLDKEYDVLTPVSVHNVFNNQSISEKEVGAMSSSDLCTLLKVDGILFSSLYYHNDVFFIDHSLKMNFKLYDSAGDSLWINNLEENNKPILYALGFGIGAGLGSSGSGGGESKGTLVVAGIVGAFIGVAIADGIVDEQAGFIEKCLYSLPDGKGSGKEIKR